MGTEAYLAPELFDPGPMTPAADLWSLGATLYAAAEGGGPFDKGSSRATLRAILLDDLPVPRCEAGLADAITGLLRRDPRERATIDETRARLRPVAAQQQPPQQQPVSPEAASPSVVSQPAVSRPAASQGQPPLAWDPTATTGVRSTRDAPAADHRADSPAAAPGKRRLAGFPARMSRRTSITAVVVLTAICAATAGVLIATHLDSGRDVSARTVASSSEDARTPASSGGTGPTVTPGPAVPPAMRACPAPVRPGRRAILSPSVCLARHRRQAAAPRGVPRARVPPTRVAAGPAAVARPARPGSATPQRMCSGRARTAGCGRPRGRRAAA